MPKFNVIITGLFISLTVIATALPAHSSPQPEKRKAVLRLSSSPNTELKITQVKISTNTSQQWQPNAVLIYTDKRPQPVKIYTASANEALTLRIGVLTSSEVTCSLNLGQTCSSYKLNQNLQN